MPLEIFVERLVVQPCQAICITMRDSIGIKRNEDSITENASYSVALSEVVIASLAFTGHFQNMSMMFTAKRRIARVANKP